MPYHVITVREMPLTLTKHGKEVKQLPELDNIRVEESMCNRCVHTINCKILDKLIQICIDDGVAMLVTQCGSFDKLHEVDRPSNG